MAYPNAAAAFEAINPAAAKMGGTAHVGLRKDDIRKTAGQLGVPLRNKFELQELFSAVCCSHLVPYV